MKVLITGICGFVGSSVARLWREADADVTLYGMDNLVRHGSETNRGELRRLGIQVFHGDIRLMSDFETLPAVDYVIDAAANPSVLAGMDGRSSSRQVVEHNLLGTMNMLEFCKAHRSGFILLSTSRVYSIEPLAELKVTSIGSAFVPDTGYGLAKGISLEGVSEDFSNAAPVSLYGATKLASETMALEYGAAFDFPVWINRCGVLAGAGQFGHVEQGIFSFWLHSWLGRQPIKYIGFGGMGHQVRDALHPADLLEVLRKQVATGKKEGRQRIINLGGGRSNSMSLANLSGWCEQRWGPHAVGAQPAARRYDIPWLVMDTARARAAWNWQPSIGLPAILEEIAEFAEKHPEWLKLSAN